MSVQRKVVEWADITGPRLWKAKLECGHEEGIYDDIDDSAKKAVEEAGGSMRCFKCERLGAEIKSLEDKLAATKARRACT